jgi:hypothetical protein
MDELAVRSGPWNSESRWEFVRRFLISSGGAPLLLYFETVFGMAFSSWTISMAAKAAS